MGTTASLQLFLRASFSSAFENALRGEGSVGSNGESRILWNGRAPKPFTDGFSLGGSRGLPTGARSSDQPAEHLSSPHRVPRPPCSRQAPLRGSRASVEDTWRTPFQRFHGPWYSALACTDSPADTWAP